MRRTPILLTSTHNYPPRPKQARPAPPQQYLARSAAFKPKDKPPPPALEQWQEETRRAQKQEETAKTPWRQSRLRPILLAAGVAAITATGTLVGAGLKTERDAEKVSLSGAPTSRFRCITSTSRLALRRGLGRGPVGWGFG